MGISITAEARQMLNDLRARYETLAREADQLHRLTEEGEATMEDCNRIEQQAREAYNIWQQIRVSGIDERGKDRKEKAGEVPRDI